MFVDLFFQLIQVALNGIPSFQLSTSPSSLSHSGTSPNMAGDLWQLDFAPLAATLMLAVWPIFYPFSPYLSGLSV